MFSLHPQLAKDTLPVGRLALCRLLLSRNALFPWVILVPEREGVTELIDLSEADRRLVMDEICLASEAMRGLFQPDKLNVAALGNQVPQLHIHVVARFKTDAAWPEPVWGKGSAAYTPEALAQRCAAVQKAFANYGPFVQ